MELTREEMIDRILDLADDIAKIENRPTHPIPRERRKGLLRSLGQGRLRFEYKKQNEKLNDVLGTYLAPS